MIMPEKYKKYNLIPMTIKQGIDIIIHDDEYLETLEKKVNKKLSPYKYTRLSDYIRFLKNEKESNPEYSDEFDKYIQNLIEVNDINNWSVMQYILPSQSINHGAKREPSFIQGKYYFMIYAKHVDNSYSLYTINEQEKVLLEYVWPVTCFEIIEGPNEVIKKNFNAEYAVEERKTMCGIMNSFLKKKS